MMWEVCTEKVEAAGTKVLMETVVTQVEHKDGRAVAVTAETEGVATTYDATSVISSMPMSALLRAMEPPPPAEVLAAADALKYRDFITVAPRRPDSTVS
jgi:protoporphyrinogen oxidase